MTPIKKIDMHVHCCLEKGPERLRGETWPTVDELRVIYDEIGVEKGVEMARMAPERSHDPITNRDAQRLSELFPSTIGWWFCCLDPRMGTNSPTDDLGYYIGWYRERGARGVGEIQAGLALDDPRYMNLFAHIEKSGLPVTIHFGVRDRGCGPWDDLHLPRLRRVLETFPRLTVLGHAMPFWAEISADVTEENRNGNPKGPVTEGELARLLRAFPNLMCDISAGSGHNALTRDPDYTYRFFREFHERIVYGTDIRQPSDRHARFAGTSAFLDGAYAAGVIGRTQYENIARNNALRLLEGRI